MSKLCQIAILRWYGANQTTEVATGAGAQGVGFDGANIWVANGTANTVTKIRANDGSVLTTVSVTNPFAFAYDGANIWVSNFSGNTVTKLLASTGAVLGTFTVGANPAHLHSMARISGFVILETTPLPSCELAMARFSELFRWGTTPIALPSMARTFG